MANEDYPHPAGDSDGREFWRFCRLHELRLQCCTSCGLYRHHPRPRCLSCHSPDFEWTPCSGRGHVHSFTICHLPVLPAFEPSVPYNVVVIKLEEGPFMVSNLVGVGNEELRVGLSVKVCFTDIDDDLTIPQFRLAEQR